MISIDDMAAILDTHCQALWSLEVQTLSEFVHGPDRNIILSRPTALQELSISVDGLPLFTYSLISQSPDLTRLRLSVFDTTGEVTRCFGEKLEHLDLQIMGKHPLPRLGCMNLKSLYLGISRIHRADDEDTLEDGEAGDLSNIRCLTISTVLGEFHQDRAIYIMRCYNIGRNPEGLILSNSARSVDINLGDIRSQAPIVRTLTTLRRHICLMILSGNVNASRLKPYTC
jgi:hypothetical protein